jgi:tRNA uridine 5-carboxymethylaminomethyl modification enzyme
VIDARYEGYLAKQRRLAEDFRSLETVGLPEGLDYAGIEHLRAEAREKLAHFRPQTLGQASRIGGVTPADITVIGIYLKKGRKGCGRKVLQ